MPAIHRHDYTLAMLDTLAYGEDARMEEEELTYDQRAILEAICLPVREIVEETVADIADFAADFEEISEKYFS
jgi:hypothetical protein